MVLIIYIHQRNQDTWFWKLAGLSLLKRTLLSFQAIGGKKAFLICGSDFNSDSESDSSFSSSFDSILSDTQIKIEVNITTLKNIPIKSMEKIFFMKEPMFLLQELWEIIVEKKTNQEILRLETTQSYRIQNPANLKEYLSAIIGEDKQNRETFQNIPVFSVSPIGGVKREMYREIHQKKDILLAEKIHLRSLRKKSDTWISRSINRPISLFFTRFLLRTSIQPNSMTMITLVLSIASIFCVLQIGSTLESYLYGFLGGFLFHMASVVDGCDGEIARSKFLSSKRGEILDSLVDDGKNIFFTIALGIRSYSLSEEAGSYLWTVGILVCIFFPAKVFQYRELFQKQDTRDIGNYLYFFEDEKKEDLNFFWRGIVFLKGFARGDLMALLAMVFGLLYILEFGYWVFWVFLMGMSLLIWYQNFLLPYIGFADNSRNKK